MPNTDAEPVLLLGYRTQEGGKRCDTMGRNLTDLNRQFAHSLVNSVFHMSFTLCLFARSGYLNSYSRGWGP